MNLQMTIDRIKRQLSPLYAELEALVEREASPAQIERVTDLINPLEYRLATLEARQQGKAS